MYKITSFHRVVLLIRRKFLNQSTEALMEMINLTIKTQVKMTV
jgi:hypothetical protein